jgi:hypothetical protein
MALSLASSLALTSRMHRDGNRARATRSQCAAREEIEPRAIHIFAHTIEYRAIVLPLRMCLTLAEVAAFQCLSGIEVRHVPMPAASAAQVVAVRKALEV